MYTMKAVALKTGLSAHIIRAWEKRYRAIEPARTSTNRRLYCEQEVQRLLLLRKATLAGHSIGRIAQLANESLLDLVQHDEQAAQTRDDFVGGTSVGIDSDGQVDACIEAIEQLDSQTLDSILMRSSIALSQPVLIDTVIVPFIQKIGAFWRDGNLRIAHEHLASGVLRTFLANMRSTFDIPETAPRIVVTTPSGQMHELGALIVAVVAASAGWQVTYLGTNLPAEEIGAAVEKNHAKALALSLVYPCDDASVVQELIKIKRCLPAETSVMVGGRAAGSYTPTLEKIGAKTIVDLNSLRKLLEAS